MSNWHPKPLRPQDPSPLFQMDDSDTYVVKALTPMQRQRAEDQSSHTMNRASALSPSGEPLYLDGSLINKGVRKEAPASYDVDAVLKSYMAAPCEDEDEDTEKGGIASAASKVAAGVGKAAARVVSGAVGIAGRGK